MTMSLRHNLPYKILALILSVALWFDVKLHQEPDFATVQVPLEVQNVQGDMVATPVVNQVTAVLYGPKVYVSHFSARKVRAYVDLKNSAAPGVQKAEVRVDLAEGLRSLVAIQSIGPDHVDVRVRRIATKAIPVTVDWTGPPIAGSRYGIPTVTPAIVQALGPDDSINQVDHCVVTLPGGDPHVTGLFPVVPVDAEGTAVNDVKLSPDTVTVEAVLRTTAGRQLALVLPAYDGVPAPGFRVDAIAAEPQVVNLIGPRNLVNGISSVRTRPVIINNARSDVVRMADIAAPRGSSAMPATVQVRIRVRPTK
jgi:YbbR domain-containing protein